MNDSKDSLDSLSNNNHISLSFINHTLQTRIIDHVPYMIFHLVCDTHTILCMFLCKTQDKAKKIFQHENEIFRDTYSIFLNIIIYYKKNKFKHSQSVVIPSINIINSGHSVHFDLDLYANKFSKISLFTVENNKILHNHAIETFIPFSILPHKYAVLFDNYYPSEKGKKDNEISTTRLKDYALKAI